MLMLGEKISNTHAVLLPKIQKLLEVLHGALPKMSLIASDFSYLPDVKIPGERAPLVSTKVHSIFSLYPIDFLCFFVASFNLSLYSYN